MKKKHIIASGHEGVLVITDYDEVDQIMKRLIQIYKILHVQAFKIAGVIHKLKQQQYYNRCNF